MPVTSQLCSSGSGPGGRTRRPAPCACRLARTGGLPGMVLNSLLRGLKSHAGGRTPKLASQEKQCIIRDALIARTVKCAGALLVTDNMKDFALMRRFCAMRYEAGEDFFARHTVIRRL